MGLLTPAETQPWCEHGGEYCRPPFACWPREGLRPQNAMSLWKRKGLGISDFFKELAQWVEVGSWPHGSPCFSTLITQSLTSPDTVDRVLEVLRSHSCCSQLKACSHGYRAIDGLWSDSAGKPGTLSESIDWGMSSMVGQGPRGALSGQGSDVAGETPPGHERNLSNQKSIASHHRPLCMSVNSGTIRDDSWFWDHWNIEEPHWGTWGLWVQAGRIFWKGAALQILQLFLYKLISSLQLAHFIFSASKTPDSLCRQPFSWAKT